MVVFPVPPFSPVITILETMYNSIFKVSVSFLHITLYLNNKLNKNILYMVDKYKKYEEELPSDRLGRPLYNSQRGSYLRRSNRIVQFATKISPELDRQI